MPVDWNARLSRAALRASPLDCDGALAGGFSPKPLSSQNGTQPTELAAQAQTAIGRTREWLFAAQHADGYWAGELEGDSILESEYILLLAYLGRADEPIARKCAAHIAHLQLPMGGWAIYPGGPVDISASVKAYFALKLTGADPSSDAMHRARKAILAHGGADAVNSFTRFYLALLNQIDYEQCPAVPPEFVLLPKWFPVNLTAVSAWSRTIIVPLSIMSACRPVAKVAAEKGIRELFLKSPPEWPALRCPGLKGGTGLFSWDRFFRAVDRGLKRCQRRGWLPFRGRALRAAERWMVERFAGSDGLGAIFPPMIWSIVALRCLGYRDDSPEMRYCHERLEGLILEEEQSARLQPCKSPVWDTAIALRAIGESGGSPEHSSAEAGVDWLLSQEIRRRGDWAETVAAEPGGWCFEHANEFYPDLDDTSMVVMALQQQFAAPAAAPSSRSKKFDPVRQERPTSASDRAKAAEDELLPPPSREELQAYLRRQADMAAEQEGTPQEGARQDRLARVIAATMRAERWMLAMQNRDGGWGAFDRDNNRQFLCYVPFADHNAMIDPSTPDLAARVLESLGLLGRRAGDPAVDRGIAYLRRTQEADGSWFGRWGVNYVYGTWQVLVGLQAVGVGADDPLISSAADWLIAHQQPDGGWGESPDSYADPRLRGVGPTTASQTAWGVMGLLAAGRGAHTATRRGIQYLVDKQRQDGTWDEPEFTGTGFPQVFYLRYHLYPIYFPLLALARYLAAMGASSTSRSGADLSNGFPFHKGS